LISAIIVSISWPAKCSGVDDQQAWQGASLMTLAELIPIVLKVSIMLLVVSIGLASKFGDSIYLLRRPALLAKSFLSIFVIMPVFAATLAALFDLHPAVKIALIALAVSPLPPLLPIKAAKAGSEGSYIIGLLVMAAVASIIFVPLAIGLLSWLLGRPTMVSPVVVAKLVLTTVLLPLIAGILIRSIIPGHAARFGKPLAAIAMIVLLASVVIIMIKLWPAMMSLVGNGTVLAFVVLVLAGLAVGHFLGGPDSERRTNLAFATSTSHPGVAIAIGTSAYPEQPLVPAAVGLYFIVCAIVSIPYIWWSRQRNLQVRATSLPARDGE
jgi:BASS family bile acid:Na+ symporter